MKAVNILSVALMVGGLAGCSSSPIVSHAFGISDPDYPEIPACQGTDIRKWHNCSGVTMFYRQRLVGADLIGNTSGIYEHGQLSRNITHNNFSRGSSQGPSTADQLEGWSQILQGVQGMVGAGSPSASRSAPSIGTICPKSSEYSSGIYKTCVYKCVGGQTTQTVRAGELCPASASF